MTAHAQLKALKDKYARQAMRLANEPYASSDWDRGKDWGKELILDQILEDLEACLAEHEGA